MSGPAKFKRLAIVGVISMFVKRQIVLHLFNRCGGFIFPENRLYLERGSRHYLRGDSKKSGERALAAIC